MPSELVDLQGLSQSSYFPDELRYPNERQVGFWKTESMPETHGLRAEGFLRTAGNNSIASSTLAPTLENRMFVDSSMGKYFDVPSMHLSQNKQADFRLEKHLIGADRVAYPRRFLDHDSRTTSSLTTNPASYLKDGQKATITTPCNENGLFSSSLSELLSQKMILSSNDALYGRSVGAAAASNHEEEEPFESLEEIEAQTIGNLLPNDDDLLSGVTDGFDYISRPGGGDDVEELDFFSSVGGLDLGEDSYSSEKIKFNPSNGQLGGSSGAPAAGHPSRTLFVRNINSNIEEFELRALFDQYGDIQTLYTACKHRGFVMVSYYDIRAAENAMKALQSKPLRHRKLDIHFSIPKGTPSEKDINQGTLAVSKLDSGVTNDELRQLFGVYGDIKEIREVPHRGDLKFIEFYDIRAAEASSHALSRNDFAGMRIKLEPSHPGGNTRLMPSFPELKQGEFSTYLQQYSSPSNLTLGFPGPASNGQLTSYGIENSNNFVVHSSTGAPVGQYLDNGFRHGNSSSVPSNLSSLGRAEIFGYQSSIADSGHSLNKQTFEIMNTPIFHPHSLPDYHDDTVFSSTGNGSAVPPPAHNYIWNNSPRPQGMMWPNSPSFVNGVCSPQQPQRLHAIPRAPSHMLNSVLPINSHQVGSAPSVNPSLWDRRNLYAGESPDPSSFHPGSFGNMRISSDSLHSLEFVSPNIFPRVGGNCMDLPISSKGLQSPQQSTVLFPNSGQMYPMMIPFDSPNERIKGRRNEGASSQSDNKKQYELDIDRITRGDDKRTTLMIKNIPNKQWRSQDSQRGGAKFSVYTSKMLLAAIDEHHRGTYDFIYLPIDFKNKCNVGYAFINMTDPSLIIPFYQAFNGKKWEKFNSEKVASLAYARIQGKASLIAHFQNSSLMNEDKRCRPILFNTEGPNAGDQVPFPMGANIRSRPNKNRAGTSDESHLDSSADMANGEEYSNGGSSSGSLRDAD